MVRADGYSMRVRDERLGTLDLARHYLELGRPRRALETLQRADLDPQDPEVWRVRAQALFDDGQFERAAKAARDGLALDPEDVDLLETLALAQIELDQVEAALASIERALQFAPWWGELHAQRALMLARGKRFDEAREAVAEAGRMAPDSTHVLRVRAQVEFLAGNQAEADRAVEELLRVDPENPIGHVLLGNLATQRAEFEGAVKHFGTAARLNPESADVTEAAREARVYSHPLFAPLRPLWRLQQQSRSAWIAFRIGVVILALAIPGLVLLWLLLIVLSWAGPPLVRRWQRRRHGW